jgi:tRNA (cytidine/uridine-2'-O-)-methyltransferase
MRLVLFQPDIAANTGTLLRTGACLGVAVDIILPCGFPASDRSLKRALMDYADHLDLILHPDWTSFDTARRAAGRRLILVETGSALRHTDFAFAPDDLLMLGRESAGTPTDVAAACDAIVSIPMQPGRRSLNVAIAGAIALGEALRQTGAL